MQRDWLIGYFTIRVIVLFQGKFQSCLVIVWLALHYSVQSSVGWFGLYRVIMRIQLQTMTCPIMIVYGPGPNKLAKIDWILCEWTNSAKLIDFVTENYKHHKLYLLTANQNFKFNLMFEEHLLLKTVLWVSQARLVCVFQNFGLSVRYYHWLVHGFVNLWLFLGGIVVNLLK